MSAPLSRRGDWIQTYTLRQFWPLDPRPEDVDVYDVAHALSMQCRFTGHVDAFYSVAEHSVRVSLLAEQLAVESFRDQGRPPVFAHVRMVARWGLLHDADEAYLADVARPVKHQPEMAAYRKAARRVLEVILSKYGLPLDEPSEVLTADRMLLATEARDLFRGLHPAWEQPAETLPGRIQPWTPGEAERRFLDRFWLLTTSEAGGGR